MQGTFKRRIKSVALTIPAIVGPYTTVACTVKLLNSTIRLAPGGTDEPVNMPTDYIATSHAQSDSGVFQFDFSDERYLPFEGHGVSSQWNLQLPDKSIAQFDYSTITDVILTVNYTSHSDESKRLEVIDTLKRANFGLGEEATFMQLLSLKSTFPDLWAAMSAHNSGSSQTDPTFSFDLQQDHFPYKVAGKTITVEKCEFAPKSVSHESTDDEPVLVGNFSGQLGTVPITTSDALDLITELGSSFTDLYILVTYKIS